MSQPFCTGPCWVFCGVGSGAAKLPLFLGTSENGPRFEEDHAWEDCRNEITGTRFPHDTSYQGLRMTVRVDLTRWNESVLAQIASVPDFAGSRGVMAFGAIGALIRTEGLDYPLWIRFPYQSKLAMATMPSGYRFFSSKVVSITHSPLGTAPRKVAVVWLAEGKFDPLTGAHGVYDHNMAGLPDPVTAGL